MLKIIYIVIFVLLTAIVYLLILRIKSSKYTYIATKVKNTAIVKELAHNIGQIKSKKSNNKFAKYFTPAIIIISSVSLFIITFILFKYLIKINSTAFLLAIQFSIIPFVLIKMLINNEKKKIITLLPTYVVNLKNNLNDENNLILAIKRTPAQQPLSGYMEQFISNVSLGMNVNVAFDNLAKQIDVKEFSDLVSAFQVCQKNGGNFITILSRYIVIITKEINNKEEAKEKAYSSILTLIVMVILNIFVIIFFVFGNGEYAQIIRETFIGRMILNFNVISYAFIAYLISRIYKEE